MVDFELNIRGELVWDLHKFKKIFMLRGQSRPKQGGHQILRMKFQEISRKYPGDFKILPRDSFEVRRF